MKALWNGMFLVVAIVSPLYADTNLLTENFSGTVGNAIAGWNGWTGDSHMKISGTTINQGYSAGCTSGPDEWSTVAKSFSYTLSGGQSYVLTATISAPNTSGDYSSVRLATASGTVYVGAVLYAGTLYFLQDGDLANAIQITQSATVMDVKVVARGDQRSHFYYRNHGGSTWTFAGSLVTGDALSSYTQILVCGHEGTGYAGNTDSINLTAVDDPNLVLFQEDFNGAANSSITGWNGWTGDSHMRISGTTIDQGNSAGCTSGPEDWSTVAKSFSYTPSAEQEYALTATLSAPNTTGDYSSVRLATASGTVYVGAVLYGGTLYLLQDGDLVNAIQIAQSATVMDVKMVARTDQRAYCYYRNHGEAAWIFAGSLITGDALSSYTQILVCGHEGTGYAGNTDSILLQAQQSISRGHQVILDKGLQLASLVYQAEFTNPTLWENAQYTTLNLFEWPNSHRLSAGQQWCRQYNPAIPAQKYLLTDPCPYPDHCKETDYVDGFRSMTYGDEITDLMEPSRQSDMAACYREWNVLYPNCLAYTNFEGGQYSSSELATYMLATYPDMLMFDLYATFDFPHGSGYTRDYWYYYMQQTRTLALTGNYGSSPDSHIPIPYAQHLRLFRNHKIVGINSDYDMPLPSESYVRLQKFASWAFGYTYIDDFVYNSAPGAGSALFDSSGDSAPYTALHNYVAGANNESKNLGPALKRLLSTDVRMIVGRSPIYDHFNIVPLWLDTNRWTVTGDPRVGNSVTGEVDHQVTLDSSSGNINMVGKDATWSYDTYSYKVGKSAPTGSDMGFGLYNSSTNYIKLHKSSSWNLKIRKSGYSEWVSANLTNTPAAGDVVDFVWTSSSISLIHKRNGVTLQTITRSSQVPTVAMKAWMWSNSGSVLKIDSVSKTNGVLLSSIPNISAWNYATTYPGGCTYITSITPRGTSNTANPIAYCDWLIGYFKPLKLNNSDYPYANGLHFMIVNGSAGNQGAPGIVGPPRTPPAVGDAASASAQWVRIVFNFTGTSFAGLQRLKRSDGSTEVITSGSSGWTSLGSNQYQYDLQLDGGTGDLFRFYPQ